MAFVRFAKAMADHRIKKAANRARLSPKQVRDRCIAEALATPSWARRGTSMAPNKGDLTLEVDIPLAVAAALVPG